jgi:hypothetical protein
VAVRDLLWACPLCRTPNAIKAAGKAERCATCGADFRRGHGATIVASLNGKAETRPAGDWLRSLGELPRYTPDSTGRIPGPDAVTIKRTNGQNAFRWRNVFLGWVETYDGSRRGDVTLRSDGLHFQAKSGDAAEHWTFDTITGIQPASSAIQITLRDHMVSVKYLDASVRLWTQAISDAIIGFHRVRGHEVYEFNPHVRTRPIQP